MGGEARQRETAPGSETAQREITAPAASFERDQKLQTLGMLASGVAHDFNNLLVAILGNAGLALLDLEPNAKARPQVEEIKRAATRAAELTEQVLAYAGRGSSPIIVCDLNAIIADMVCLLRVSIAKTTEFDMQLAAKPAHIEADPSQVRQVLMNLILNAAQALPARRGTIRIASSVTIGQVILQVSDDGVGMDHSTAAKIFDPYYTTRERGSGLGLAAVKRIADRHGASIEVETAPGEGSHFTVCFAATDKALAPSIEVSPELRDYRGYGEVLVIDDEAAVLSMVAQSLERCGFEVRTESNPKLALELCRKSGREFRLVILDLSMPHKTGEETLRALRRHAPDLPVLLSSGLGENAAQDIDGAIFNGFLAKPYTPQQLLTAIRRVLRED